MGTAASVQTTQIFKQVQEKVKAFPNAEDVTTIEEARKQLMVTRNLLVDLSKAFENLLVKERTRKQKEKDLEKEKQMWVNS